MKKRFSEEQIVVIDSTYLDTHHRCWHYEMRCQHHASDIKALETNAGRRRSI
jgi:hypothetical protein